MMKISKPVLTNECLLSPVQFTSLNTIVFKNVKNIYEGNEKILLEYEHSSKIEPSSRDWIGLFPRGWSTLQQYVTFEWVSQSLPSGNNEKNKENGDLIRRTITFCSKYHMGSVNSNSFYQFVYVSKQIEVLGVSSYFRFDTSATSDTALELECLVPVSSKLRSTSVSDFGVLLANKISSTTSLDTRTLQTTSIHSLHNLEADGKNWTKPQIPLSLTDQKKPSLLLKKSNGDILDPYTSHSEPVFPMCFPMAQCKKCFHFKRGGEFLRSQQVLQSKLKIVMERNKILEDRAQDMKKEMERLQTESKRLKTIFYNTNKEKVAYEKFVKDFIKSLEKDSVVRVVNGNTEFLVKKVNYVGMEEHPRDKKTSKRERELKAVIGLQEITIRNLINSLQEKAKSVKDLNQTVKLAQAFSEARDDTREFGSDAEETLDEVSTSDVTSEYEFSLTKPSPPEEVTVEDTDAVLDGIRRATEMELKDIGISRSLGKTSSRDSVSESEFPSVCSYQSEGTQPKKPRLFDNTDVEAKVVQRRVIESDYNNNDEEPKETEVDEQTPEESAEPVQTNVTKNPEMEGEPGSCESFYDACEAFNSSLSPKKEDKEVVKTQNDDEKDEDVKKEKKNFLVTAIIPTDLDVKEEKNVEEWLKVEKEDSSEKKLKAQEKAKKFTCQLSIDFAAKVVPTSSGEKAIENKTDEPPQNQTLDLDTENTEVQLNSDSPDKPLLFFKKSNKCLEIQITQVDQKENTTKNYLHRKMVVKFEKDPPQGEPDTQNPKFQFNLALTGLGDKPKPETEPAESENQLKLLPPPAEDNTGNTTEVDATPRTIWNDAADDLAEYPSDFPKDDLPSQKRDEEQLEEAVEETEIPEEPKKESEEVNLCEDSLRYEKNLEFLQQKTEETIRDEEVSKNKPTAILIQNGQTKLALIRYQ